MRTSFKLKQSTKIKLRRNNFRIFVVGTMYEKAQERYLKFKAKYEKYKKKSKELSKTLNETRKVLNVGCEIITVIENRNEKFYSCDCGRKNKYRIEGFFSKVVSLKDKYNLWGR